MVSPKPQTESGHDEFPSITFLKALFKNCHEGFVNLRFFPSGTNLFIPLGGIISIASILEAHYQENAYFAVATRKEGDESKEEILEVSSLWVNLEFKNLSQEKKQEIRERYRDFPLRGTFVILTGGEINIYWLLKEPISPEKIPEAEDLLRKLASYFGDDSGVADVSQAFRIPGTLNYEYSPPKGVILDVFFPKNQYTLSDFAFLLQAKMPNGEDEEFAFADEEESAKEDISPKSQDYASEVNSRLPSPSPHESDPQTSKQFKNEISESCDPENWIELHREIEKSVIFQNEGLLKLWVWCLIRANHEDQWVLITTGKGTTRVFVKRGQFVFGRKKVAKALKMDESTIYKRMKKLRDMGNLNIQSKPHYSLITIANWNERLSFDEKSNTQNKTQGTPN